MKSGHVEHLNTVVDAHHYRNCQFAQST